MKKGTKKGNRHLVFLSLSSRPGRRRQQAVLFLLLIPIYLNKKLFLLPRFSTPLSCSFRSLLFFGLFVVVAPTFDLVVSWLSNVRVEEMGGGSSDKERERDGGKRQKRGRKEGGRDFFFFLSFQSPFIKERRHH